MQNELRFRIQIGKYQKILDQIECYIKYKILIECEWNFEYYWIIENFQKISHFLINK